MVLRMLGVLVMFGVGMLGMGFMLVMCMLVVSMMLRMLGVFRMSRSFNFVVASL